MATIQFWPAYLDALAQFVSRRARMYVGTAGYVIERPARAFVVFGGERLYAVSGVARSYAVSSPAREFKVFRPSRTYRITP